MVDIKEIKYKIECKITGEDKLNYSLYLRSIGIPASGYNYDYPLMADGIPILSKPRKSNTAPNLKITTESFNDISTTKASYMVGNGIVRDYGESIQEEVREKYKEFDRVNSINNIYYNLAEDCAGWGSSYMLAYLIDGEEGKTVKVKKVNAWNAYVEYNDETEMPVYGCIYGCKSKKDNRCATGYNKYYYIYVYDSIDVYEFKSNSAKGNYSLVSKKRHGFTNVPLIEFRNEQAKTSNTYDYHNKSYSTYRNTTKIRGNAERAVPAIDAYETLKSDNATEGASLGNAYLVLKNLGDIDDEARSKMEAAGIIFADGENAEAQFLTKNINSDFISYISDSVFDIIWRASSSINPKSTETMKEARAFQVKQMYQKLNKAANQTKRQWDISLERLDKLLKSYWTVLATPGVENYNTYDINYVFHYDIPTDFLSDAKDFKQAGGVLPNTYLIKHSFNLSDEKAAELNEEAQNENPMLIGATGIEE